MGKKKVTQDIKGEIEVTEFIQEWYKRETL